MRENKSNIAGDDSELLLPSQPMNPDDQHVRVVYAWTIFTMRINTVSAGADWVRGGRKHWITTYELTRIHLRTYGSNQPGLFLADQERTVEIPLDVLQYERKVWDFVHLGMRHSAASGAELNLNARATFPQVAEAARNATS